MVEIAVVMPDVMSGVVGVFVERRTPRDVEVRSCCVRERRAQSVFVPPTSTPMRYMVDDGVAICCERVEIELCFVMKLL